MMHYKEHRFYLCGNDEDTQLCGLSSPLCSKWQTNRQPVVAVEALEEAEEDSGVEDEDVEDEGDVGVGGVGVGLKRKR